MKSLAQGIRIGEVLEELGVLTSAQVQEIVAEQRRISRPFGLLAEQMFDIDPRQIEDAWIQQYCTYNTEVDLDTQRVDTEVLKIINRRQAWQFRMLPMRRENDELVTATSAEFLRRAVNFSWRSFEEPIYFLIARRPQLEDFLMQHYPWASALELPAAG
ncbi:MAG: hypothetical protein OER86_04500 [Phycisphaerae bacterium]|nr:hypothetical protein [Phycisphaerae bacterium]